MRAFKKVLRTLRRRSILWILILTIFTFLLGTFGFRYFENEAIREDNEAEVQRYLNETGVDRKVALERTAGNRTPLIDHSTSFYWTFTTVTTVGYGDYSPTTPEGRIVYYIVGITGISVIGLVIGELGSHLLEMSFMRMRGLKKSKLRNHVILVGWNATTVVTHAELTTRGNHCVVIDEDKDFMEMKAQGVSLVAGNAMDTDVLKKAGIGEAKAIILPIKNDENTAMISLKAKQMNRNIQIIASVKDEDNVDVVGHAGVTSPIPSSKINGLLLANAVDEKRVVDFIVDVSQETEGLDISQHVLEESKRIKDIPIGPGDKIIVAYRKGKPFLDFTDQTKLDKGDWVLSLTYHEKEWRTKGGKGKRGKKKK